MSDWSSLKTDDIVPSALIESFELGTDAYRKYLETVQATIALANLAKNALSPSTPSVLQAAVQAVVDIVEGFLQTGKIHVLFIPIGKVYPRKINSELPASLRDVAEYFGVDEKILAAPTYAVQAYGNALTGNGGNAGFLKTFVESLMDERDPNRPQYTQPNDAVAMQVILTGAHSFSGAMKAASALNRIFTIKADSDLAARRLPTPQNLRAKVIGVPTDTRMGVRLDWTSPPVKFSSKYFPGSFTRVKRVAIIRSTDPRIRSKTSVMDHFPTQDLTAGLESTDGAHKVIGVTSGATTTWIDNEALDVSKTYYYGLAWELEVAETGALTTLPFDKLSSVVKVNMKTPSPTQVSVLPDWRSLPAPLDLIPNLSQQSKVFLERLKAQANRANGTQALLAGALDNLSKNLTRQVKQVDDMAQQLALLNEMFSVPIPALYTTSITGIGGNAKLVSELAARLFNPDDPDRPMFNAGEYTMGICVVAGGPRIPDLSAVTDLLSSLFSSPDPTDPFFDVLEDIEATVGAIEDYVFNPSMQAYPQNPDGTIETPDGPVDPSTIDPNTGNPIPPVLPVTAEDGDPVATMDPANPNAGDTDAASCSS
jgi:hypothetical protein